MAIDFEAFGLEKLTVAERLDLIEHIWDSLPENVNPDEVPEWHLVELAKRRSEATINPGQGKPWRDVIGALEGGT